MQSWGCDVPIGTIMQDHNTFKKYKWTGTCWAIVQSCPNPNDFHVELKEFVPGMYNAFEVKEHVPKRGRPKKVLLKPKKTRMPSEYNLYIKKQILQNAYPHLTGKDKLKQIAKDWRTHAAHQSCGAPLCEAHRSTAARVTPLCEAHRKPRCTSDNV